MITIGKPFTEPSDGQVLLCAQVTIQERTEEAWFSVEPESDE